MENQINFLKKLIPDKETNTGLVIALVLLFFLELLLSFPFPLLFIIFGPFLLTFAYGKKGFLKAAGLYFFIIAFFSGLYQIRYQADIYNGNKIAQAIEEYQKSNNSYPENLNELVPNYLEKIPFNWTCYHEWHYRKMKINDENSYMLTFLPYGFEKCSFEKKENRWICRD